jgi:hypothetical protein
MFMSLLQLRLSPDGHRIVDKTGFALDSLRSVHDSPAFERHAVYVFEVYSAAAVFTRMESKATRPSLPRTSPNV